MTEDLGRLVQAAEGHAPSAEFVAGLRSQIVAETEASTVQNNGGAGARTGDLHARSILERTEKFEDGAFEVDLGPRHETQDEPTALRNWRHRRTQLLAAAAAVIVVFIGILTLLSIGDDNDREELDTIDDPTPTTEVSNPIVDPTEDGDATQLTGFNIAIESGSARIDTLGTAFTFSVEELATVGFNANGVVSVTDVTSRGVDDRTITFRRTSLLPDPAAPTAMVEATTGWPAEDVRGWLEAVDDEIKIGEAADTTLGGLDATFVEIEVPCAGSDCISGEPISLPDLPMFTPGSRYRLWVVDQGQEDPIVVIVAIDDDDEVGWFDEAGDILASVAFESIEPNPVTRVPAGTAALAVFDGVSFDLPDELLVVEPFDGFARILPPGIGGDVEFLTRPLNTDGVEVTTTEQLLQLLADETVEVTELNTPGIGGFDARSFSVASGPFPNIVLKTRPADLVRSEFGWESPQVGHLWIIEHPNRGLLIVSAEALAGPEVVEPMQQWTHELLQTLEFREQ